MFTMFLGPVKAGFELICGDSEGAERTLEEFSQTNPIIAPLRGGAEFLAGDTEAGKKTFSKLGGALESALNTTPVVGHVKGVCHALGGDVQKGREIYLQATRSTAVAGAGIGGFFVAGPVGAAVLASETGTLWDVGRLAVGDGEANGVARLVKAIKDEEDLKPGEFFDSIITPVTDGAAGVAAGKMAEKLCKAWDAAEENKLKDRQFKKISKEAEKNGVKNPDEFAKKVQEQATDLKEQVAKNETQLKDLQERVNENKANTLSKKNAKLERSGKPKIPTAEPDPEAHVNGHTSCMMMDEEGNTSTGYSSRLRSAAGINCFEQGVSKLCQAFPEIKNVIPRALKACAEHMSFEKCTQPFVTFAVQIRDGIVTAVERCKNCAQYPLGTVLSDALKGEWIPDTIRQNPGTHYAAAGACGVLYVTVSTKEFSKRKNANRN